MDTQKIGRFIAENRKKQNMTQAQLAEKLSVTGKTVSRWENGNYMPDLSLLQPLAQQLGVTLNELLQGEYIPVENLPQKAEENLQMTVDYSAGRVKKSHRFVSFTVFACMLIMVITGYIFTQQEYIRYGFYDTADQRRNEFLETWDIVPGQDSVYWRDEWFDGRWFQVCMYITRDKSGIFLVEKIGDKYQVADRCANYQTLSPQDDNYIQMHVLYGDYHDQNVSTVYIHWDAFPDDGTAQITFRQQPIQKMATVNGYTLWYRITDYWPDFAEITYTNN